jgi:hypothetical protein
MDKFLPNWLQKPSTWPVGPIDLRFDRARGVWVSPQPYKIITAKLLDKLNPFSNTNAIIINQPETSKLIDKDGNILETDINLCNLNSSSSSSSQSCVSWTIISIGCNQSSSTSCDNKIRILTSVSLEAEGLKFTTAHVIVNCFTPGESITIPVASCTESSSSSSDISSSSSSSSSSCIFSSSSSSSISSSSSSSSSSSGCPTLFPTIRVYDRIGQTYSKNTYIYAYYDTSTSEYIVLEGGAEAVNQNMAYGYINPYNNTVNIVACSNPTFIGETVSVDNPLGLSLPQCEGSFAVIMQVNRGC